MKLYMLIHITAIAAATANVTDTNFAMLAQGTLTEGEGSVHLTSSLFCKKVNNVWIT
jgi:hypothetical protein